MSLASPEADIRRDQVDDQDRDKFSHYVDKNEMMEALVSGKAIQALCGKKWVPTRDGLKFPVCPECQEKYNSLAHD